MVTDDVMQLEAFELALESANFLTVGRHVLVLTCPLLGNLIDHQQRISIDEKAFDS